MRGILIAIGMACCIHSLADDRVLFNLKGPVKTATFDTVLSYQSFPANKPVTRSFSEDGTLLPNDALGVMTVTRYEEQVTFKYESWEGNHQETFFITPEGKTRSFKGINEEGEFKYYLSYDNGDIYREGIVVTNPSGQRRDTEGVYKVIQRDKYGNWTRRKAIINRGHYSRIETCTITYYE